MLGHALCKSSYIQTHQQRRVPAKSLDIDMKTKRTKCNTQTHDSEWGKKTTWHVIDRSRPGNKNTIIAQNQCQSTSKNCEICFVFFFFGTTKSNTAILPLLPYRCGNENRIYVRECICVREYKCVCMYVYVLCIPHALGKKWHIKKHRGNYTSIASCKATLERDKMTE